MHKVVLRGEVPEVPSWLRESLGWAATSHAEVGHVGGAEPRARGHRRQRCESPRVKIAFPYPSYWPYVRRGAERCIHDIAGYLAVRGHDVEIITSTPGRGARRARRARREDHVPGAGQSPAHVPVHAVGTAGRIRHRGVAAHDARASRCRAPVELLEHQLRTAAARDARHAVPHAHHHAQPLLAHALRAAWCSRIWCATPTKSLALTRGGADAVHDEYGVPCDVLSPPVDMEHFHPVAPRDPKRPVVLFPADLADERKGGALLFKAWNRVHREIPGAVLALAGPVGLAGYHQDHGSKMLAQMDLVHDPAARAQIEFRGPGDSQVLPYWYSQAAVTVLPSVEEAFGMVLVESLACGTPVVGSAYDGPGEIITDPRIGATVALPRVVGSRRHQARRRPGRRDHRGDRALAPARDDRTLPRVGEPVGTRTSRSTRREHARVDRRGAPRWRPPAPRCSFP